jgi:hypothetical protein
LAFVGNTVRLSGSPLSVRCCGLSLICYLWWLYRGNTVCSFAVQAFFFCCLPIIFVSLLRL